MPLLRQLESFQADNKFDGKGPLCVALVMTDIARSKGLPLSKDEILTKGEGQVSGLGKAKVQSILRKHEIVRVLAEEGGRTSRGSVSNAKTYIDFLNALHEQGLANLDEIEAFWISRVKAFFATSPLKLSVDRAMSIKSALGYLFAEADKRSRASSGIHYLGAVYQHLVGAKLTVLYGDAVSHNSFSTADAPSARAGDFELGSGVIHVTTTPTEALARKCKENCDSGLNPVIITSDQSTAVAEALTRNLGVGDRVDVLSICQFLVTNSLEGGQFEYDQVRAQLKLIIDEYNAIVSKHETDPGLRIEMG